jgi:hypothetical protein
MSAAILNAVARTFPVAISELPENAAAWQSSGNVSAALCKYPV